MTTCAGLAEIPDRTTTDPTIHRPNSLNRERCLPVSLLDSLSLAAGGVLWLLLGSISACLYQWSVTHQRHQPVAALTSSGGRTFWNLINSKMS